MHLPPKLTTTRLDLVVPSPSDSVRVLRYYEFNRGHLAPTDPLRAPRFYTLAYWQERLSKDAEEFSLDQSVRFFLDLQSPLERFIGSVNFTQISRGPFQACYLGYSIDRAHQGKGLMFEALQAAIGFMFDQRHIHRIMANHLPENERSAKLLRRLGFRVDGVTPDYLYIQGRWQTHVLNSLTNPRWSPRAEDAALF